MDLFVLFLIIGLILLGFYLFRSNYEGYISGKYVLEWSKPQNTGGDPKCCGYDWQICNLEDKTCATPVQSGSVGPGQPLTADITKVDWGNTYNVMVRAKNIYGNSDWTTAQLVAGGGTLENIVFGQSVDKDGNITVPINASSKQITIWAAISAKESKGVGNLAARTSLTQIRDNRTVAFSEGTMTSGTSSTGQDTFTLTFQGINTQDEDVFKGYVFVADTKGSAFTDGTGSSTVSGSVPGSVGNITLKYLALGAPIPGQNPIQISCQQDINMIYQQLIGPNGGIQTASAYALAGIINNPNSGYSYCTETNKGYILMFANAAPAADPTRTCQQAITLVDPLLTTPEAQCGASLAMSDISNTSSTYMNTCSQAGLNPIIQKWNSACNK
ncbi:MAG TPA: hypothetical protein PKD85_14465 [Saprospiraceae bacterium]|nr:hypothetical protein [Saprospiraceae bacterium]